MPFDPFDAAAHGAAMAITRGRDRATYEISPVA
jgi:hypothetical protein